MILFTFFRHLRLLHDRFFYYKLNLLLGNIPTSGASVVRSADRFHEETSTAEPGYNNNGLYYTPYITSYICGTN